MVNVPEEGFVGIRMGYASAMSTVLFLGLVLVTLVQMRVLRSENLIWDNCHEKIRKETPCWYVAWLWSPCDPGHYFDWSDLDRLQNGLERADGLADERGIARSHETTLFNFQRVLGLVDASDPRITQTGMAKIDFFRALLNSVILTALALVPQIFFSATAAYAFAA